MFLPPPAHQWELSKSLKHGNGDRFALQRLEHLRRTITGTMEKLATSSVTSPKVLENRRRPDNQAAEEWDGSERRHLSNPQ